MKIIFVVGARPQFIKLSAIVREIERRRGIGLATPDYLIVHTGQHYDYEMSQVFFDQLNIPGPNFHLGVGSASHGEQTGRMLQGLDVVLAKEHPELVVVFGDTNSTLAGALASAKMQIPVAHVEAGARSYNRAMPEELNRVLTDHASDILFCSSTVAVRNLQREGFTNISNDGRLIDVEVSTNLISGSFPNVPVVINVGDVMYDALLMNLEIAERQSQILEMLRLEPKGYLLATIHRAENTDDLKRLHSILGALMEVAKDVRVIVPLHPRTRASLSQLDISPFPLDDRSLTVISPVGYLDMLQLEKHARAIVTDSGGVQKEAYWLGVPCITIRSETEWIETVEAGWNALVGVDPQAIIEAVWQHQWPRGPRLPVFGMGQSARAIVELLV